MAVARLQGLHHFWCFVGGKCSKCKATSMLFHWKPQLESICHLALGCKQSTQSQEPLQPTHWEHHDMIARTCCIYLDRLRSIDFLFTGSHMPSLGLKMHWSKSSVKSSDSKQRSLASSHSNFRGPVAEFCAFPAAVSAIFKRRDLHALTVHTAFHDLFARLIPGFSTQNLHNFNLHWGMLHSWKFSKGNFGQDSRIHLLVIFNSSHYRNQRLIGQVLFSTKLDFWTSLECLLVVRTRWNHSVLVQFLTYCGQSGMPFKDFCGAAPASKLTCMQTVSAALHNSFARLTLGCSTQNHNFGQSSRIDLLVIFNSSHCRLVGQLLFSTKLDFWTSLECLLGGKDLNLSSCNIFKGATAWQDQHKVESFSSNSSGIVALLLAVQKGPRLGFARLGKHVLLSALIFLFLVSLTVCWFLRLTSKGCPKPSVQASPLGLPGGVSQRFPGGAVWGIALDSHCPGSHRPPFHPYFQWDKPTFREDRSKCLYAMLKPVGGGNESQKHPSCNQAFTKAMDAEKQRLF